MGGPFLDRLAFYALLLLSVVVIECLALVAFWLTGKDVALQDHCCTDEDLVRLATARPDRPTRPARWPK